MHQTYVDQGNSDNSEGMKELNENERSAGDGNESSCASRLEPLGTSSEKKCNEGNCLLDRQFYCSVQIQLLSNMFSP